MIFENRLMQGPQPAPCNYIIMHILADKNLRTPVSLHIYATALSHS